MGIGLGGIVGAVESAESRSLDSCFARADRVEERSCYAESLRLTAFEFWIDVRIWRCC